MVSSIEQTGYSLYPGSGTYGDIVFTRRLQTFTFGQNTNTRFDRWCNTVTEYPTYYTRVIEEGTNREFINNSDVGAPTLPVTVESEINGQIVTQNLAPSILKSPVKLYFKLRDGYSLPSWLQFIEGSGVITGKPPDSISSFTTIEFNDSNKRIEIYFIGFDESFNQPFNQSTAILFGYAGGRILFNSITNQPCPT